MGNEKYLSARDPSQRNEVTETSGMLPSLLTGQTDDDGYGSAYGNSENLNSCDNSLCGDCVDGSRSVDVSSNSINVCGDYIDDNGDAIDDAIDTVDGFPTSRHQLLIQQPYSNGIFVDVNRNHLKSAFDQEDIFKLPTASHTILRNVPVEVQFIPDETIPERILCLDGGGVKGIVEAVTLKYFSYALERHHLCGSGDTVVQDLNALIKEDLNTLEGRQQEKGLIKDDGKGDYEFDITDSADHDYDEDCGFLDNRGEEEDLISPKLHRMFDIVTGTSTGSIIATAIARLHWDPEQLIRTSKEIAPLVFPKPYKWNLLARMKNSLVSGLALFSKRFYRYSAAALEKYLKEKLGAVEWAQRDQNEPIFGIVAIREDDAQVHVFNSTVYQQSKTVKVHEAVRASTAAPTYFSSCKIVDDLSNDNIGKTDEKEMKPSVFVDGGLSANCPANYTMSMMQNSSYNLGCLLSVGCGDGEASQMPCTRVLQMAMSNKQCWQSFYNSHPRDQSSLFRLTPNSQSGIGSYDLADSGNVDEMEKAYTSSLCGNVEAVEDFRKSSTHLFAKSIHVLSIGCEQIDSKYQLHLVVKTSYNNRQYAYIGGLLRDKQLETLAIQRYEDGLPPLSLKALSDPENDIIKITYEGVEIVGSPVRVVRKIVTRRTTSLGM